jgi:hypothetical protein
MQCTFESVSGSGSLASPLTLRLYWLRRCCHLPPSLRPHNTAWQRQPDHGEKTYKGFGRLKDKRAIITGGDSGEQRTLHSCLSTLCTFGRL